MINLNTKQAIRTAQQQKGAVTLIMSMVLLGLITLISLYTSRSLITEQKIVNNDLRSKQAFEAAEAGIAEAANYLSEDADRDLDGNIDSVFDTDNNAIGDSNNADFGSGSVIITVTDLSPADAAAMSIMRIQAVGFSDDNVATRTVFKDISTLDPLPNSPDNPMTTRGTVVVTGAATVHNPEGHSTIWSGGDVSLGSNNSTATEVADVTDPGYPSCMDNSMTCNTIQSSNKVTVGLDVIEHDSNLSNLSDAEFFENFFGLNKQQYKDSMVTVDATTADVNTKVQLATNEVIWVDGNASLTNNTTMGCTVVVTGGNTCADANTKPSILIVDGDLTMGGTPQLYGIVFVTGEIIIGGNATVHGALVSAGGVESQTGGSLDIWYNSEVLQSTRTNGPTGSSSGSWRDFGGA